MVNKNYSSRSTAHQRTDEDREKDKRTSFLDLKEELRTEVEIPRRGEPVDKYLQPAEEEDIEKKTREGDEDWEAYLAGKIGRS